MRHSIRAALALLVLLAALSAAPMGLAEDVPADGMHTVDNGRFSLSIDPETLQFSVTDLETGVRMDGYADASETTANASWKGFLGSTLVIEVSQGTAVLAERVSVADANREIDFTPLPDGADATVDFLDKGQRLTLEIRLTEDAVSLRVPADSIEEYGNSRLCGVYLAPAFGATHLDDREGGGYILVPEAAGAIIDFSNGQGVGNTPYSKRVYGGNLGVDRGVYSTLSRDAEAITLPLYGMAYTGEGLGYLAVISEGAEASEILAYPAGVITAFNWASARFTLREEYILQTTRTQGLRSRETNAYLRDLGVTFYLLTGEDASYAGMARRYRRVLDEAGGLPQADTTYRPRLDFLGAESEKFLLWENLVPMTTVEQAGDILEDYIEAGLTPPLVVYQGWQKGGYSRSFGDGSMAFERRVGSADDMQALKDTLLEAGGRFFLGYEAVFANTNRTYNMRLDVVRTIGQTIAEHYTGMDMYETMYLLTPTRSAELLAAYRKVLGERFDLAVFTLPSILYSYYSAGSNYSRGDTMAFYREALTAFDTPLALSNPFVPYFAHTDVYLDMPLGTTGYAFLSAEVPFLPMVLSGRVPYYTGWLNFDSDSRRQTLKLIEYGAYPAYVITAEEVQRLIYTNSATIFRAQWDIMREPVLETDAVLRALHAKLDGAVMTDHYQAAESVAVAVYDNGCRVVVNYRARPYMFEGLTVPGAGYLLLEGGEAP